MKGRLVMSFSNIHSESSKISISSEEAFAFHEIRESTRRTLQGTTLILSPTNWLSNGEYPNHHAYRRQPSAQTSVRVSRFIPLGGSYNSGARYDAVQNWAASSVIRNIYWCQLQCSHKRWSKGRSDNLKIALHRCGSQLSARLCVRSQSRWALVDHFHLWEYSVVNGDRDLTLKQNSNWKKKKPRV